jgi:hypothetical protein
VCEEGFLGEWLQRCQNFRFSSLIANLEWLYVLNLLMILVFHFKYNLESIYHTPLAISQHVCKLIN